MKCVKCGRENADDAVYCQKCGGLLEPEEETQVASKIVIRNEAADEEIPVFSVGPTLIFVKIGYGLAALGALLVVGLLGLIFPTIPWFFAVPVGLALLLIPAWYHLRKRMIRYTLTDAKVEIDEGFIVQNSRNVPLRSIQDVSVTSTLFQRMLGFGDVVIDNASEDGGKIVLRNIDTPKKYADQLLRQMRLLDR